MRTKIKVINDFESKYDCEIKIYEDHIGINKIVNDLMFIMQVWIRNLSEEGIINAFLELIDKIKSDQKSYNFVCGAVDRAIDRAERLEKIIESI